VREGRGSEEREDPGDDGDGLMVLGEVEVLIGGVVQGGVAGAIGDNGAVPDGADHVHVGGSALDLEGGFFPLLADSPEECANERRVLLGSVRGIGPPESELTWATVQALDLMANVVRRDAEGDSD